MDFQYLKKEQYYIDLYDLITIKDCLDWETRFLSGELPDYKGKKIHPEIAMSLKRTITDLNSYFIKGEKFKRKSERIREWMERDREKQKKFDEAIEPQSIYCPNCSNLMQSTSKDLEDYTNQPLRVSFIFECPSCKKRKAVYDNGEDWIFKPQPCPKCSYDLKNTYKRKGDIITTISKCTSCNYSETEKEDIVKNHKQWEEKQAKDRELLQKYRSKFCLSEKEGTEYIDFTTKMHTVMEMMQEKEKKSADPVYQKAIKLKIVGVVELEKLLTDSLRKVHYIKLIFDKPEMGKQVVIPFTVQDADAKRSEYDSTHNLQKIIKSSLEGTNWKLMAEGTTYRLGYVSGRLKGYEGEDNLVELVETVKAG